MKGDAWNTLFGMFCERYRMTLPEYQKHCVTKMNKFGEADQYLSTPDRNKRSHSNIPVDGHFSWTVRAHAR